MTSKEGHLESDARKCALKLAVTAYQSLYSSAEWVPLFGEGTAIWTEAAIMNSTLEACTLRIGAAGQVLQ